ncbi:hypothetical protein A5780_19340 [Nocardia sp. 852002-20019_SCH5090214]|nr:hypothetical protein A5780_19340 [Nocardia sp. 852002-20019_SCH5090214]
MNTRDELAQRIDLSYRALTDLENGKRAFSMNTLAKVEQALEWAPGTSVNILEGKSEPESTPEGDLITIQPQIIPIPQVVALMEAATRARTAADAVRRESKKSLATVQLISAAQELEEAAVEVVRSWFGGRDKLRDMAAAMNSFIASEDRQ